ncbi:hypothetical protein ACFSLT_04965 [Novosphingobium resinovorum]
MREQAVKASEARLAGQVRQQQEQQAAAAKAGAQGGAGVGQGRPRCLTTTSRGSTRR